MMDNEKEEALQRKLISVQKKLLECQFGKDPRQNREAEVKTSRVGYMDSFETATDLLKTRLRMKIHRILRGLVEQVKMNFRSDLLQLTYKNLQLVHLFQCTQQSISVPQKYRASTKYFPEGDINADTKADLSSRRRQRCDALFTSLSPSPCCALHHFKLSSSSSSVEEGQVCENEGYFENFESQICCGMKGTMRKLDIPSTTASVGYFQNQSEYRSHPTDNQLNRHQYHQQNQGLLEALPEEDSDDEDEDCASMSSPPPGKREDIGSLASLSSSSSSTSPPASTSPNSVASSNASRPQSESPFGGLGKLIGAKSLDNLPSHDHYGVQEANKISVLQNIICQLRDELKECKDQNELLEFRILEMQEVGGCPSSACSNQVGPDYERGNGHANVTESRSSCSDCSESLSLQESGIFDGQSTEDSSVASVDRLTISRDLVTLTMQIEEFLGRFNEEGNNETSGLPGPVDELALQTTKPENTTTSTVDLSIELQTWQQRLQTFERRVAAMTDFTYVVSLEEKIQFLLNENRKLENEKAEIEEAENDNRLLCQRLEEKLGQVQKRKLILQNRLAAEKNYIKLLQARSSEVQEREKVLCLKITQLESLLQNYEQRNFELEESFIEMKCSVQFVLHATPMFALCLLGALLRRQHSQSHKTSITIRPNHRMLLFLTYPFSCSFSNVGSQIIPPPTPSNSSFLCDSTEASIPITVSVSSRKHKLQEEDEEDDWGPCDSTERCDVDIQPRLKKLKRIFDKTGISCFCDYGKLSEGFTSESIKELKSTHVQTDEDLWKIFVEQAIIEQRDEWHRAEKVLLKKIEILECDIDKCQDIFDQERATLMKMYEKKLIQKESQLQDFQSCQSEKESLQKKWDCLVQELERFALYLGSNLSEKLEPDATLSVEDKTNDFTFYNAPSSSTQLETRATTTEAECAKNDDAMSLPLLFEDLSSSSSRNEMEEAQSNILTHYDHYTKYIHENVPALKSLQTGLQERIETFDHQEEQLLNGFDRLMRQVRDNSNCDLNEEREQQRNVILCLRRENERLISLFQDHEKCWGDLQRLQVEHEKMKLEVASTEATRKQLEDSQKSVACLRNRVEELERIETHQKTQLSILEKKEQKCAEKVQQLRDEIQFLRNKCSQLQDEVDVWTTSDAKNRREIQQLNTKLKESRVALEQKEIQLEDNETALQTQITKLKDQLGQIQKTFADTECSNGMLREEVSYLERTVQEAVAKCDQSESLASSLYHELKQKDQIIEEMQRKLDRLTISENIVARVMSPSSASSLNQLTSPVAGAGTTSTSPFSLVVKPNDLSAFSVQDGGLYGVARDVEEVVTLLQRCSQCEHLGTKLMDIVERLIVLIQILKTSQGAEVNMDGYIASLSRCESEEILNPCNMAAKTNSCLRKQGTPDSLSTELSLAEKASNDDRTQPRKEEDVMLESESHLPEARVGDISSNGADVKEANPSPASPIHSSELEFRVLRKISSDSLLVSWSRPYLLQRIQRYEIAVNGRVHLRIRQPDRCKVILFGLNFDEPLQLTLRCNSDEHVEESTVTYIN